jgi:hypothetical protein
MAIDPVNVPVANALKHFNSGFRCLPIQAIEYEKVGNQYVLVISSRRAARPKS